MWHSVRTLVLRANCNESIQRPYLISFAELFTNLKDIRLDGVYPALPYFEKTGKDAGSSYIRSPQRWEPGYLLPYSSLSTGATLPPLSISIFRAVDSNTTNHEPYTSNLVRQIRFCAGIGSPNAPRIETLHVEFPMSRSLAKRRYPDFWEKFGDRMKGACSVPATTVNLCIPGILIDGEIEQFLVSRMTRSSQYLEQAMNRRQTDGLVTRTGCLVYRDSNMAGASSKHRINDFNGGLHLAGLRTQADQQEPRSTSKVVHGLPADQGESYQIFESTRKTANRLAPLQPGNLCSASRSCRRENARIAPYFPSRRGRRSLGFKHLRIHN